MSDMGRKNKIIECLLETFRWGADCDTCDAPDAIIDDRDSEHYGEPMGQLACDECHHKYVNWQLSKTAAAKIATNILKIIEEEPMIKFISYNGKYPNLCYGDLTLEIKGKTVTFNKEKGCFWKTGGGVGFSSDWEDTYVNHGPWRVESNQMPLEYREYAKEIENVINQNIPHGCCGGCI